MKPRSRRRIGRRLGRGAKARYSDHRTTAKDKIMALEELFPIGTKAIQARGWRAESAWILLLLAAAIGSSFTFACVTPFAAFAVLTAGTMRLRHALGATIAIWAVNQFLGYGFMGYPLDGSSLAWGIALAVACCVATAFAAAIFTLSRLPAWLGVSIAFVAAFAAYESVLLLAALFLGDSQNFAPPIVAKLALSDAGWLLGLGILRHGLLAWIRSGTFAGTRRPIHS
jgi:hypothetical protein